MKKSEKNKKAKVCITVALSRKRRAIGNADKLLWHIPDDLKRFKQLTLGHPVIMGRKTFDSIMTYLGKPLPERTNIVVTRSDLQMEGIIVCNSLEEALEKAHAIESNEIHIGGGSEIYTQTLPYTDRLYLTLVDDEPEADTFFPEYNEFTKVISSEKRDYSGLSYEWLTLERS